MRPPIFEKITLTKDQLENLDTLIEALRESRLGQAPTFVEFEGLPPTRFVEFGHNLAQAIRIANLQALWPYPFYIVGRGLENWHELPCVAKLELLPRYFIRRSKRLKTKEQALCQKGVPLAQKLYHLDVNAKLKQIEEYGKQSRELYDLTKELNFYEGFLNHIGRPLKEAKKNRGNDDG